MLGNSWQNAIFTSSDANLARKWGGNKDRNRWWVIHLGRSSTREGRWQRNKKTTGLLANNKTDGGFEGNDSCCALTLQGKHFSNKYTIHFVVDSSKECSQWKLICLHVKAMNENTKYHDVFDRRASCNKAMAMSSVQGAQIKKTVFPSFGWTVMVFQFKFHAGIWYKNKSGHKKENIMSLSDW